MCGGGAAADGCRSRVGGMTGWTYAAIFQPELLAERLLLEGYLYVGRPSTPRDYILGRIQGVHDCARFSAPSCGPRIGAQCAHRVVACARRARLDRAGGRRAYAAVRLEPRRRVQGQAVVGRICQRRQRTQCLSTFRARAPPLRRCAPTPHRRPFRAGRGVALTDGALQLILHLITMYLDETIVGPEDVSLLEQHQKRQQQQPAQAPSSGFGQWGSAATAPKPATAPPPKFPYFSTHHVLLADKTIGVLQLCPPSSLPSPHARASRLTQRIGVAGARGDIPGADKDQRDLKIRQVSTRPPHFALVRNGALRAVANGPNNLWYSLVLFFRAILSEFNGFLGYV